LNWYLPAWIVKSVSSTTAGLIWEAMKRFQIRV
jgi:hypothetical protein